MNVNQRRRRRRTRNPRGSVCDNCGIPTTMGRRMPFGGWERACEDKECQNEVRRRVHDEAQIAAAGLYIVTVTRAVRAVVLAKNADEAARVADMNAEEIVSRQDGGGVFDVADVAPLTKVPHGWSKADPYCLESMYSAMTVGQLKRALCKARQARRFGR